MPRSLLEGRLNNCPSLPRNSSTGIAAAKKAVAMAEAENKAEKDAPVAKRIAAQKAMQAKHVAARLANEEERQARSADCLLGTRSKTTPTLAKVCLDHEIQELKLARGEVCTEPQSRIIQLWVISLTKYAHLKRTAAISNVCAVLGARAFFI